MELYFSPFEITLPRRLRREGSFTRGARHRFSPPRLIPSLRQWRRRIYERRLLAQFGEIERHDIAITPADIDAECAKPFWRP